METETAVVESPQENVTSIEDASTNDLREALGLTEAPSQEVAPESEAPAPEAVETPLEPIAEGQQPEVEGESEEDRLAKRRIRPRNELDQQVIDLYRSEGFSGDFADASRIIYQTEVQSNNLQPQVAEATQPDPYQGYEEQALGLQGEIQALEAKVAQAAEDLETTEALSFQRDIMRKELQLQSVRDRKERRIESDRSQAHQTHRSKAMESRDRVYEQYPDMQNKDSVLRKQFDDYVSYAQQDPDYAAIFDSPKWPELLAGEFSSKIPQQGEQALPPQAPPLQPPQLGTQAKVLTTGTTAQPANAPLTADGIVNSLPTLSSDDLFKLLGNPGGPQPQR
jgi:hypothetical protein